MTSDLTIRIALICLLLALIMFCAQVETADEMDKESIFEPTYLSYDDIYRDFTQKKNVQAMSPGNLARVGEIDAR